MQSQTVDFGIDLGTTNSLIARATRKGVEPVKNRFQSQITPSAVAHTSRGQTLVGQDALNKPDFEPATQFKRLMGSANRMPMHDGVDMSPEELSAEVLKELKAAVQLRYDEQLRDVVVTVPAMFQQPQCDATHRAAQLAGLNAVALVQEPIAAATAYLAENPEEGYYLVYDLGGGTFDVSLVRLDQGEMNVVAHGGDNYLGGGDFDQGMYRWLLNQVARESGPQSQLEEPINKFLVLQACERARVRLSTEDSASIDLSDVDCPIDEVRIQRLVLEDLIEELVSRTVSLAHERLSQAELPPAQVNAVLLVGGPTMTPYIRHRLNEEFGVPLSLDQDPMTVVACGAALYASSILRPNRAVSGRKSSTSAVTIELHYEPVSPDPECTISGRIAEPSGFSGEIRMTRSGGDWDSGWMPLTNGAFVCEVSLRPGTTTEFQLLARDLQGNLLQAAPATVSIRHGVAAARPVTPYDYGVALADGNCGVVLRCQEALPAYGRQDFAAARTIPAGSAEELPVYFVEGRSPMARDNVKVGELRITGGQLRRTLREGEKIEVRIQMDESRLLKARVSIPLHDLDYEVELCSLIETPPVSDLAESTRELREMLADVQEVVDESDVDVLLQCDSAAERIEADLEQVQAGEIGAAERATKRLSEAKGRIRLLSKKYDPAVNYTEAIAAIDRAESLAREFDDSLGEASMAELRTQADKYLRLEQASELRAVVERADRLFWLHYTKKDECWIGLVEYLRDQRTFAKDAIAYDEYLKRADDCLSRTDFQGVRINGAQAMTYLPNERSGKDRLYDAGLRS